MWIFGKKSNQPAAAELPPELRPFYGQNKAKGLQARSILVMILIVVIVVAAVFGGLWLHSLNTSVLKPKPSTHQTSTQATKGSHKAQVSPTPKTQANPAVTSQPAQSITPSSTIPNTGPGLNIFLVAFGSGLIGAVLYHIRQVRNSSNIRPISEKRF
jgi:cytoskeletal protein RodZ